MRKEILMQNKLAKGEITNEVAKEFAREIKKYSQSIPNNVNVTEVIGVRRGASQVYFGIYEKEDENISVICPLYKVMKSFPDRDKVPMVQWSKIFQSNIDRYFRQYMESLKLRNKVGKQVNFVTGLEHIGNEISDEAHKWQVTMNRRYAMDGIDYGERVLDRPQESIQNIRANKYEDDMSISKSLELIRSDYTKGRYIEKTK